jgi:hypothetical protein
MKQRLGVSVALGAVAPPPLHAVIERAAAGGIGDRRCG